MSTSGPESHEPSAEGTPPGTASPEAGTPSEDPTPAPSGSWWTGRRGPVAVVLGLVVASLAVWLGVAQFGGSGGPTPPPGRFGEGPAGASPDLAGPATGGVTGPSVVQEVPGVAQAAPPPPVIPRQPSGEAGFATQLGELGGRPAGAEPTVDPEAVGIARQTCTALQAGSSRATVEGAVMRTGRFDQKGAESVVTAAVANFCPDLARPAATSFRDGVVQAGTDVAPGAYRTTAADGCSWVRSTSPDAANLAGVVESGTGAGRKSVTLEPGQYFTTSGCAEWSKVP